jgi:nicotinamidase-related amidase
MSAALLVIDVQKAFDDEGFWGRRNNPSCEANVAALIAGWRGPRIYVRHDSLEPGSPLAVGSPGNAFKDVVTGSPDLLVTKHVNSAFYGSPDLHEWLSARGISSVVLCGITTNHCVETTARMAANLGYAVSFVLDATHTFDRAGPDGVVLTAGELARATATSLHGEFASVVSTSEALAQAW